MDATGTVESISLIVASILSKKLASGTTGIVFDVKTGDGAFLKTVDESRELGRALVDTSRAAGRDATGWITDMSRPLGSRITAIKVGGEPLDNAKTYRVATNDFMARGGDGYTMLRDAPHLLPDDDSPLLANAVMDYLKTIGTVRSGIEGRIILR